MIVVHLILVAIFSIASLVCTLAAWRNLQHDHRRRTGNTSGRHLRYLEQRYFRECDMWVGD